MSQRALRRHHRDRMIAKARIVTRRWHSSYDPDQLEWVRSQQFLDPKGIDHTDADKQAVRVADHLAICPCFGCRNPRHAKGWGGPVRTRQEQAHELSLGEQLGELGDE